MTKRKNIFLLLLIFLFSVFLLTFKTLQVPPGIETDEGSIVYNAVLVSRNLHDQNGRLLPFFFLSSDHIDWKQPVLVYLSAIFLKIFGANLFIFKMVNVVTSLITLLLLGYLVYLLYHRRSLSFIGMLVFLTTPIVIITSRIGNESIQPVLYTTLWLLFLVLYRQKSQLIYLALAAFSLGIDFYCFKGMRIIVPVYIMMTVLYLFWRSFTSLKEYSSLFLQQYSFSRTFHLLFSALKKTFLNQRFLIPLTVFIVVLLPFFLIIPFLEGHYPGAVFDRHVVHLQSYRFYVFYWLSNLSFPFLYASPDIGRIYSVELFGGFFLPLLPFFLFGIKNILSKLNFNFFILLAYLFTPFFFGFAESVNYSHRLLAIVPFFVIIVVLGFDEFFKGFRQYWSKFALPQLLSVSFLIIFSVFSLVHFGQFFAYYYFQYPNSHDTQQAFGNNLNESFFRMSKISRQENLTPYVQSSIYDNHGDGNKFYNIAYFNDQIKVWHLGDTLPDHCILMTQNNHLEGFVNSDIPADPYFILLRR